MRGRQGARPHPLMRLPRAGDRELRRKDVRATPFSREERGGHAEG